MGTETVTYKFKKGDTPHLDDFYIIQGLAGGDWWDAPDPSEASPDEETATILEDITIKITVKR